MSKFSQILKIVGIVVAVVVAGVVLGWLGSRGSQGPKPPAPTPVASAPEPAVPPSPAIPSNAEVKTTKENSPAMQASGDATPGPLITNWEDRVDAILSSEGEDAAKAKQMLEMFPHLPEEGQTEVAQHLANLTPDQDFSALGKYLTNSSTPESVLDVLMADLLNRPNSVKLPMLVDVARDSQNPKATEAKDLLELFLEQDYGTDWNTWQGKVGQWLKDNPD
jgi:hypothetical protein